MKQNEITRLNLKEHFESYPRLQAEDIFKYLFQSSFGCEHLVQNEDKALSYVKHEYETFPKNEAPRIDHLDGCYSRVHLSWLNVGLSAETLTRLFCLSSRSETDGKTNLIEKLGVAEQMIKRSELPFDIDSFFDKLEPWRRLGFPALHHSDVFRTEYRPAYRVIANEYVLFLPVFAEIDRLLHEKGRAIVAIEGGSASGKTTLSDILNRVYGCRIFHMDDFFLRPEQRTPERFAEIGGNFDRERFIDEVIQPLSRGEAVTYHPFDCSCGELAEPITLADTALTVIEGVYSMHPDLSPNYNLSVFLDISPEHQRERILKRNSAKFAERFFSEWIPLENIYFSKMQIKEGCDLVINVGSLKAAEID